MKKKAKKLLVFILVLSMVLGSSAFTAFADENVISETEISDSSNEAVPAEAGDWWSLDRTTGTLNIWGSGPMEDFGFGNAPWYPVRDAIHKVIIGNGVTSISYNAFRDCTSLTEIEIPESVQSIGGCAFYCCTSLTAVELPSGVNKIESNTFYGCGALSEINIPSGVTEIGRTAFYSCTSLTDIEIPNGVTRLYDAAFSGCTSLKEINIPASVTEIAYDAFLGCSGLTDISVDSGNEVFDSRNDCNAIIISSTDRLLLGCRNTIIPSDVKAIGTCAFAQCSSLKEIEIPDSVTAIYRGAFHDCTSLKEIEIPSGVTYIEDYAFYKCTGLTTAKIKSALTQINGCVFSGCTNLSEIEIPSTVTEIGFEAFRDCTGLSEITIPEKTTSIDSSAFRGCSGVTKVSVDSGNTMYDSRSNCNAIIETTTGKLIWGCSKTEIPSDVTAIGNNAFADCTALEKITIPSSVSSIGTAVFLGCSSLTEINIPSSVTSIGYSAFDGCSNLKTVRIMGNVSSLSDGLFRGCDSLYSIFLPVSVKNIENSAFSYCSSLTDVYYTGSESDKGQITLGYNNEHLSEATWHYDNSGVFADVLSSDWFCGDVLYVYNKGIMKGMGGTLNFDPGRFIQRQEFANILWRLAGENTVAYEAKFPDVPEGEWFTTPIIWAYKNGIITGYASGKFGVGDNVTREQFATMLYRYAKDYMKIDVSATADLSGYVDKDCVSDWALEAMKWAVGMGIITGKDNKTRLDPAGYATRCECAAMIRRFLD